MLRTKGEAGTGDIVEAVRHLRRLRSQIRRLQRLDADELMTEAKNLGAPYDLVLKVAETGKLPVPNFAAGGIATPADAALCMGLGSEAVFVGSGIFKSSDPERTARAIVHATANFEDAAELVPGLALRGSTRSAADQFRPSCAPSGGSGDHAHLLRVARPSRLRVRQ